MRTCAARVFVGIAGSTQRMHTDGWMHSSNTKRSHFGPSPAARHLSLPILVMDPQHHAYACMHAFRHLRDRDMSSHKAVQLQGHP